MSVKQLYKNYKYMNKSEKESLVKWIKATTSLSVSYSRLKKKCPFSWLTYEITCPNFDKTSLDNLSLCQECPLFEKRLHYEICKDEYYRVCNKKNRAREALTNAIRKLFVLNKGR